MNCGADTVCLTDSLRAGVVVPIPKRSAVSSKKRFELSCARLPEPSTKRTDPEVPLVTAPPIAIPPPPPRQVPRTEKHPALKLNPFDAVDVALVPVKFKYVAAS